MERVDNIRCDNRDLVRLSFQEGLQRTFPACREPLPSQMLFLLQELENDDYGGVKRE
jgi:hypothetical protein